MTDDDTVYLYDFINWLHVNYGEELCSNLIDGNCMTVLLRWVFGSQDLLFPVSILNYTYYYHWLIPSSTPTRKMPTLTP